MSKITLNSIADITQSTSAQTTINTNFSTIQTAFDNTFSRDGTSPNQLSSSLDTNSNQLINLPAPATANSPLRLADLNSFVGGGTVTNIPVGGSTGDVLVKTSNTNYVVGWSSNTADIAAGTNIVVSGANPTTIATSLTPTFTTINGLTLGTSTGSFTVAAGKTVVDSNSITYAGVDGSTVTTQGTDTYVGRATTDTLTNKTLTAPVISTIINTGTITLPTSTDTLIGRATTDVLTNKTFDTAGTGNIFKINGTAISTNTGTGANVLGTSPTLVTPIITTSATIPIIYGGSAAGSTLALNSTSSGSPSGDSITLNAGGSVRQTVLSNGNIGLGTETAPQTTLVISTNVNTGLTAASHLVDLIGTDGGAPQVGFISATNTTGNGTSLQGNFLFLTSNGTVKTPTALGSASTIGAISFAAYNGSAFPLPRARILGITSEVQSTGAEGTGLEFDTTVAGGTTRAQAMLVQGGVLIGTGTTDPGSGNLLLSGILKYSGAPTAVSGAGPVLIGSGSTINSRMKVNLNGTDYWVPCSTTAY